MAIKHDFHEKQFLGYNRFGVVRRTVVALFCLIFYFVADTDEQMANVFFYLAIAILVLSALSMMLLHLETIIDGKTMRLNGPMTFRKVEFDISTFKTIRIEAYSRLAMNRPMFNLHWKNSLRFYTYGKWCVVIETKDGQIIRLGTQRPEGLKEIVSKAMDA